MIKRNRHLMIDTWATVCGVELDVAVEVDISPAEPDVGFAGDMCVCAVSYGDTGCVMDQMSDSELEDLTERVDGEISRMDDPADARADYLYEQRRDMALEFRQEALAMNENQRGIQYEIEQKATHRSLEEAKQRGDKRI